MGQELLPSGYGSIEARGTTLECTYPAFFITGLMCLPPLGALAACVLPLLLGGPEVALSIAPASLMALLFAAPFAWGARYRSRSMGHFRVDAASNVVCRLRRDAEVERWALSACVATTRWDPFHRGWGAFHWVLLQTPDGRTLRLGKGLTAEAQAVAALLCSWGARPGG